MQESLPVFNSMSEIAEYLGITKVSVSLALKNSPLISDELRKQVQQLARATGFSPRKYRKQTGDSSARDPVALFDPKLQSDPVAQELLSSMMQRLKELRIPFELVSNQELEKSDGALAGFSGVIFHYATPPELTRRFATLPQIFIMKEDTNVTAVDIYKPNELIAGKLAADYLIRQGFRELLLIWEKKWTYNPSEHMRLEGFRRQAGMHHIKVRELGYDQSESLEPFSNELLKNLEEVNRHAGIFAFNDQIAFTTCIILNMLGFERKKGELELISCDNTHLLRSLTPVPPAIDLHHGELARRAVDGLLWRIRNPNALPQEVLLFPELVERDSSGEERRSGVSASVEPAHFGVDCVTPKENKNRKRRHV